MSTLLALALALQTGPPSADLLLKVGDPAPPFTMRDLNRKVFSLAQHTGADAATPRKALIMAFFATWCKPCMKEIPIIKNIQRRWTGQGVEVVYLGLSQGRKELQPFAEEHKFPWRVIPDSFGLLARRYGASQLPHLFIVDGDGMIAFQHQGIAPDLQTTLEQQLARLTGQAIPAPDPKPAETVVVPRFERTLTFGRTPSGGASASRWRPLATFAGEAVEANIDVLSTDTYDSFAQALRQGLLDIANAGPLLCFQLRDQYEPIARIERQGSPTYLGMIFAPRASRLTRVRQLKGKTLGLVATNSTSGSLYPLKLLVDAGLKPNQDVKLRWLGSHHRVAQAVKAGEVDAGACYEDCRDAAWPDASAKAKATRVVAYTDEIPAELIIVKRGLSPKIKEALKKALEEAGKSESILAQISQKELAITGIFPSDGDALKKIESVVKKVGAVVRLPIEPARQAAKPK